MNRQRIGGLQSILSPSWAVNGRPTKNDFSAILLVVTLRLLLFAFRRRPKAQYTLSAYPTQSDQRTSNLSIQTSETVVYYWFTHCLLTLLGLRAVKIRRNTLQHNLIFRGVSQNAQIAYALSALNLKIRGASSHSFWFWVNAITTFLSVVLLTTAR